MKQHTDQIYDLPERIQESRLYYLVQAYCRRICKYDSFEADDLTHEVWLRKLSYGRWQEYVNQQRSNGYFYRICLNTHLDIWRHQQGKKQPQVSYTDRVSNLELNARLISISSQDINRLYLDIDLDLIAESLTETEAFLLSCLDAKMGFKQMRTQMKEAGFQVKPSELKRIYSNVKYFIAIRLYKRA